MDETWSIVKPEFSASSSMLNRIVTKETSKVLVVVIIEF